MENLWKTIEQTIKKWKAVEQLKLMKICTNAVIFSRITIYAKWMTNSKLWVLLFKLYFWFFKHGMTGDSAGSGLVIICVDWVMGELYDWGHVRIRSGALKSANLNLCKLQLTVSFLLLIITSYFVRWIYRISYYKKLDICLYVS